ncbi:hypothetical protein Syun_008441 [Stephania yunnanensis]|uniref:Uncharacterized protein n=1 Tax=Stephania yunnanensis TaxID=152371 RepID=A0AAP0KCT9_9MAGN
MRSHGSQGIHINTNMVVINVIEFRVLEDVEFYGEDVVGWRPIVGPVEEAQVLGRSGAVDAWRGCEEEGEAVAGVEGLDRGDGEDEGGEESSVFCGDFVGVQGTADGVRGGVCEDEKAGLEGGGAEEEEV